jgi:hypothetical protein
MSYLAKTARFPDVAIFTLAGGAQWSTTTQLTWTPSLKSSTTTQPHVGIVGNSIELAHGSYHVEYHIAGTKQAQSVSGNYTITFTNEPSTEVTFLGQLGGDPIKNRHEGCKASFEVKGVNEFITFQTSSFTSANFNLSYTTDKCFAILWKIR